MRIKRLLLQLLLLFGCYTASRCLFTAINARHFAGLGAGEFFRLLVNGLRFDASGILAVNGLYIALFLLPLPVWKIPRWVKLTQIVFIVSNVIALLFELSDWAYFPYNFKRSTSDVLKMVGRQGDFWSLLPGFVVDYWYVPLAEIAMVWGLIRVNRTICRRTPLSAPKGRMWVSVALQTVQLVLVAGVILVGIRGGTQKIPIGIRNAMKVTESKYAPIVLNTPFSIITSISTPGLEEVHYIPDELLPQCIQPLKQYGGNKPFVKKNVVVIVLESFSKEFMKIGGGKSYTPFLDSLGQASLICTQAYANAQRSSEGLPSIVAGVPSFMQEALTTSIYGTNKLTALPGLLKKEGYKTAFYHGGTNGTMSFDVFASAAGYEDYYGRKEYDNEKDYDGDWGIWDEPFLQYFAAGLGKMQQPFVTTVFTLTSHPPYQVPAAYKDKLPKGPLPIHQGVAYTDEALRKFFAAAATQPWYSNTLFVITADHCSAMTSGGYNDIGLGRYAIPIMYYAPGDTAIRGSFDAPTQQIDILPSVLDYLGYPKPFFAFGNSIFRPSAKRFAVTEISGFYQWLMDGKLLQTTEATPSGLFLFPQDSLLQKNLGVEAAMRDSNLVYLKAFIQQYRSALIRNKLSVE